MCLCATNIINRLRTAKHFAKILKSWQWRVKVGVNVRVDE